VTRLRSVSGPARAALLVLAVYAAWIVAFLAAGHEARDFIKIGVFFVGRSHASQAIRLDPTYDYPANRDNSAGLGNDGQFSYYMALDFANARHYMDAPAYRYSRVLYPGLAWVGAAGRDGAIPWSLLLVNWLALGGGTFALAAWLRRRRLSPWWACLFGLFPGLFLALQRDLTEPLAYALVAVAVYLFDREGARARVAAAAVFGAAGLARQTTLAFAVPYLVVVLLEGEGPWPERVRANARAAGVFAALALGPIAAYTGAIAAWLGDVGTGSGWTAVPFGGLVDSGAWELQRQPVSVLTVVVPGLAAGGLAIAAIRRGGWAVEPVCLLVNVVGFVVLQDVYRDGYTASGRVATGVVLAFVLSLPRLLELRGRAGLVLAGSAALWMSMLPVIAVYGFG
jgi:hypothetical protein